ncbi:hypothetical protein CLU79DRAFT_771497 [Phycomyces nitens]|nr:hypothetical protein CLU79DRAFT_771497 [Phycomyces nitens]
MMDNQQENETDSPFNQGSIHFSFKPNPNRRPTEPPVPQHESNRSAETRPSMDSTETARRNIKPISRSTFAKKPNLPSLLPTLLARQDTPLRKSPGLSLHTKTNTLEMLKSDNNDQSMANKDQRCTSFVLASKPPNHDNPQTIQSHDKFSSSFTNLSPGNDQPSVPTLKISPNIIKPDDIVPNIPNPTLNLSKRQVLFQKKPIYPIESQDSRISTKTANISFNTEIDTLAGLCKQIVFQKDEAIKESNTRIQTLEKRIQWQNDQHQEYCAKNKRLEDFFSTSFRQSDQTNLCFESLSKKYDTFLSTLQALETSIKHRDEKEDSEIGSEKSQESALENHLVCQNSIKVIKKQISRFLQEKHNLADIAIQLGEHNGYFKYLGRLKLETELQNKAYSNIVEISKSQRMTFIEQTSNIKSCVGDVRSNIDASVSRSSSIHDFIQDITKNYKDIRQDISLMRTTISEIEIALQVYEQSAKDLDKATQSTSNSILAQLEMTKTNHDETCKQYERTIKDIQKNNETKIQDLVKDRDSKTTEIYALQEEVVKYRTRASTAETLLSELKERYKRLEDGQQIHSTTKPSRSLLSTASNSRNREALQARMLGCHLDEVNVKKGKEPENLFQFPPAAGPNSKKRRRTLPSNNVLDIVDSDDEPEKKVFLEHVFL